MTTHDFTLIIDGDVNSDANINALFEADCDDATFGACTPHLEAFGDFSRDAATLSQAILSAISDVESVPGLTGRRVEPEDLVTSAEIAERLGRSRESVRLLANGERGPGGFPQPVSHIRARTRLWRWSDVAEWAQLPEADRERAHIIASTNAALDLRANAAGVSAADRKAIVAVSVRRRPLAS